MADTKVIQCGKCGEVVAGVFAKIGRTCPLGECEGVIVEVVTPEEKPKRTRKTNPLRWARHLGQDCSPKEAKAYPWLVDGDPQLFGPEFPSPTAADQWLKTPGNTGDGFIHTLTRITDRDIIAKETRQIELIRRTDDAAYVTISETTL